MLIVMSWLLTRGREFTTDAMNLDFNGMKVDEIGRAYIARFKSDT